MRYVAVMANTRLILPFDGLRLRHQRESRGLTLKALAARCRKLGKKRGLSVSHTTIHRWESGVFYPSAPRLALVAAALEVDIDELLIQPLQSRPVAEVDY